MVTRATQQHQQTIDTVNSRVEAEKQRNGGDRRKAMLAVFKRDPQLHRAYLIATNIPSAAAQLD